MKYLLLLAPPLFAATEKVILQEDNCNLIIIRADEPGIAIHTVGRVCTMPSKKDWAAANGLDTAKADTTRGRK